MTPAKLERLTFKGMRDRVAATIRNVILDGTFKPGDTLNDTELGAQLNVSRGPVREALLQLEKESLVCNVHGRGWFVINLTPLEVSEIISLREVLEGHALKLAVQTVTPEGVEHLVGIQQGLRQSLETGALVNALRKDLEFHNQVWRLAGHRLLEETLVRISTPYFAYLQARIGSLVLPSEEYEQTVRTHEILVDFLAKRTTLSAEECIAVHLSSVNIESWDRLSGRTSQ